MKFCYSFIFGALFMATPVFAGWKVVTFDTKFKDIYARNGKLLGIEAKTSIPFSWVKPAWKRLGDEGFFSLATDGVTIAGIKNNDKCAYIFNGLSWQRLTPALFLKFDWLGFSKKKLIGLAEQPIGRVYVWNSSVWEDEGSFWNVLGDSMASPMFWNIDAEGQIICGVQRLLEASGDPAFMPKSSEVAKQQTNRACFYQAQKNDWARISTQQFQQLVTNGSTIYGIGLDQYVYENTGKKWNKLGLEKFSQIAANGKILCGLRWEEAIKLGRKSLQAFQWNGQKWILLGTKKFRKVVTDGVKIYGLDRNRIVCYWEIM